MTSRIELVCRTKSTQPVAILEALAFPHEELAASDVDVFHPQPERLEQAQSGAVQQSADQTERI